MIYSVGCEYAIRALARMASRSGPGQYVLLKTVVDEEGLPLHFLGKIFQTLVRANILASAKGRGGGFTLKRAAGEISLREIVEAIDGSTRMHRCILGLSACDDRQPCPQHDDWKDIRSQMDVLLDRTSLADLAEALSLKTETGGRRRT